MTRNKSQKKKQQKKQPKNQNKHHECEEYNSDDELPDYFHVFDVKDMTCETCNRCEEKLQNIKFMINRPFKNNKYTHLCEKCFKLIRHNLLTKFNDCMYCGKPNLNMYDLRCFSYKTNLPTKAIGKFCENTCFYMYLYGLNKMQIEYCMTCGEKEMCEHDVNMCRLCGDISQLYGYGYRHVEYVNISLKNFYEKTGKTYINNKDYTLVYNPKTDSTIKIINKYTSMTICKACHKKCGSSFSDMMSVCCHCECYMDNKQGYGSMVEINKNNTKVLQVIRCCSLECLKETLPFITDDKILMKDLEEHEKTCDCGCKSTMDELD